MRFLAAIAILAAPSIACSADKPKDKPAPYHIEVRTNPPAVVVGEKAQLLVSITPTEAGWVLKTETPFKAKLTTPSKGVRLAKSELTAADFIESETDGAGKTAAGKFEAESAGDKKIEAALSFFLCNPKICKRHEKDIELEFTVR